MESETPVILAVEDDPDHRLLLGDALEEYGPCTLRFAGSLAEMAQALTAGEPDVVLLDLGLPDSRGLETLHAVLGEQPRLPIVVLTSERSADTGLQAVRMGASDFVAKHTLRDAGLGLRVQFAIERARVKARLDRTASVMRTFVASLGHDLRAPLRHIERAALRAAQASDDERVRRDLAAIPGHAARQRAMLDAALEYARHSVAEPLWQKLDLDAILSDVIAQIGGDAARRVTLADTVPVYADRYFMTLILLNLVGNGLKFWADTPSCVVISARPHAGRIRISVADTGMGMSDGVLGQATRPGQRGPGTQAIPGSGFGLSIASILTEAHSGTLTLASTPGFGTTATLDLPGKPAPTFSTIRVAARGDASAGVLT